jgi:hypothetical protein
MPKPARDQFHRKTSSLGHFWADCLVEFQMRGSKRNAKPGFCSDACRSGLRTGSGSRCVGNRFRRSAYGFCPGLRGAVSTSSMRAVTRSDDSGSCWRGGSRRGRISLPQMPSRSRDSLLDSSCGDSKSHIRQSSMHAKQLSSRLYRAFACAYAHTPLTWFWSVLTSFRNEQELNYKTQSHATQCF